MGRKPTKNFNLPPRMRARMHRSGHVYYYYDTCKKPRKEIPLGSDYILALRQYAELEINVIDLSNEIFFPEVMNRYKIEVIATKALSTQATNLSDVKVLERFFSDPPAPLEKIEPHHIAEFLRRNEAYPTTANRCKRLFSHIWNKAREWGYTNLPNPTMGIRGYSLGKRDVYIDDELFTLVKSYGLPPLQEAMDLMYLTGQRPGDVMKLTEHHIQDGELILRQSKTKTALRIVISAALFDVFARIRSRKTTHKIVSTNLLVTLQGKPMTKGSLKYYFDSAREKAAKAHPEFKDQLKAFWLYDLRAKAADDMSAEKGDQAAADLLGHIDVRTTKRHYLRRGKKVAPTR
ncbi:Phage-related integrase [Mycoavidus cysteinexigens]|uniref:Phage-related integrase n=2 Tax=Mycoavidus cysteinexigens TaxID=1553431 RepID=A0A2Z6EVE9_9BURK|nr:Phage-related integrase [Mycoavidus cysteinexigens]GLR01652.1 integrase [Mycoavidus cysteinexigens]